MICKHLSLLPITKKHVCVCAFVYHRVPSRSNCTLLPGEEQKRGVQIMDRRPCPVCQVASPQVAALSHMSVPLFCCAIYWHYLASFTLLFLLLLQVTVPSKEEETSLLSESLGPPQSTTPPSESVAMATTRQHPEGVGERAEEQQEVKKVCCLLVACPACPLWPLCLLVY